MTAPGGSRSALTSSTTLRFAVLLVTMTVAAMNVGIVWSRFSPPFFQRDEVCERAFYQLLFEKLTALRAGGSGSATVDDPQSAVRAFLETLFAVRDRMPRCFAPPSFLPERPDLVLPALLLGGAVALYLLAPYWRIVSRRLIRLDRAGQPEACQEAERLIAGSGVRIRRVWLDPEDPRVDGAAFGHPGFRCLVLNRGALSLRRSDPAGFRAVLHHEIAHVRNHDVDVMHATVALWRSFLWLIAVPAILVFGRYLGTNNGDRLITAFHLVVLLAVLYQMRNGVLRARELYADVQEHPDALLRLIMRGSLIRSPSGWARIRSPHPEPEHRLLVIEQPHRLADLGVGDAFALGLVLMLAAPTLLFSVSSVTQESLIRFGVRQIADIEAYPSFSAASLLLVVPVGAGVALGIWRVLHAAPRDMKVVGVARIVAAFCGGMMLGDLLASARSNLGPGLLLSGDAGWRWRGLLVVMTLVVSAVLALTAAAWPGPVRGWPGVAAAVSLAGYGSLLFCAYLPALLSARYPQHRSESLPDLLGYVGTQVGQLVSWTPPWVTPGRLAILAVGFPLSGLTMTVVRILRTRRRQ